MTEHYCEWQTLHNKFSSKLGLHFDKNLSKAKRERGGGGTRERDKEQKGYTTVIVLSIHINENGFEITVSKNKTSAFNSRPATNHFTSILWLLADYATVF